MTTGPVTQKITALLTERFAPRHLEVIDESNQHHGHAGAHPSGESHFRVRIASNDLDGLSRVAQHRAINSALSDLLKARVHALAIEVLRD
jgi:BolA family transcriptional regulator, general stress-responsive regulator